MNANIEYKTFIWLLILVTVAFIVLMFPFLGIIFWSIAISIVFASMQDYFVKITNRPNVAALMTLLITIFIVVLPFLFVASTFLEQALALYQGLSSGKIDVNAYFESVKNSFPIIQEYMAKANIDTAWLQSKLTELIIFASKFIGQRAVAIGAETVNIIMQLGILLYLTFFTLRDKQYIINLLHKALPLGDQREAILFEKIAEVTKATINGSLVVAIVQGTLGGLIFWFLDVQAPILWGGVMTLLSLVPMIGAGLVWGPVAIYFFATGDVQSGVILVAFGVGVIGLVDNVLRPLLVGRDTRLPDYLVLLSTLGGFALLGMNGFVIGPLLAVLFITCWDIFMREYNLEEDRELGYAEETTVVLVKNETNVQVNINEDS